jgi:DNA polymerase-1
MGHRASDDLFSDHTTNKIVQLSCQEVVAALKPLFSDPAILKVGQNLKYDWQIFNQIGLDIVSFDDTMVMSYALDGGKHGHGLDELSQLHCNETLISYNDVAGKGKAKRTLDLIDPEAVKDYAAEDADMCLRLYHVLQSRLIQDKHMTLYHDLDKPIVPILAKMEQNGILVDRQLLNKMGQDFLNRMNIAEAKIFEHAGMQFNLASPKQMGDVLFNHLGLNTGKKTKTGAFSTDAKTLEDLSLQGHAIVDEILHWRQLSKLKSTYTDGLQEQINPKTQRVHTSFTMTVTNTGRLSSTDPNLQNIPIRTEEGRLIRTAFIAPAGKKILSVDYSQIELRLIAEIAGIDRLKQAFHDQIDIHALTASEVFGIPLDQMTSEKRRAAKAINFGIIYGISGFGLAKQLNTDNSTAGNYIKLYMQRFPELAAYMDNTKSFVKQHGYVLTLLGRPCYMPGINSKNGAERAFAERQAINAPIQGTAADIMKLAMQAVDRVITNKNLPARLLLQVHDELVLEVDEHAAHDIAEHIKHAMENVVSFTVPITAESGIGDNWGTAH